MTDSKPPKQKNTDPYVERTEEEERASYAKTFLGRAKLIRNAKKELRIKNNTARRHGFH